MKKLKYALTLLSAFLLITAGMYAWLRKTRRKKQNLFTS